jgi:hypothetical protein
VEMGRRGVFLGSLTSGRIFGKPHLCLPLASKRRSGKLARTPGRPKISDGVRP